MCAIPKIPILKTPWLPAWPCGMLILPNHISRGDEKPWPQNVPSSRAQTVLQSIVLFLFLLIRPRKGINVP